MILNIKKKRRGKGKRKFVQNKGSDYIMAELPLITVSVQTVTTKPIVNRFLVVKFFLKSGCLYR